MQVLGGILGGRGWRAPVARSVLSCCRAAIGLGLLAAIAAQRGDRRHHQRVRYHALRSGPEPGEQHLRLVGQPQEHLDYRRSRADQRRRQRASGIGHAAGQGRPDLRREALPQSAAGGFAPAAGKLGRFRAEVLRSGARDVHERPADPLCRRASADRSDAAERGGDRGNERATDRADRRRAESDRRRAGNFRFGLLPGFARRRRSRGRDDQRADRRFRLLCRGRLGRQSRQLRLDKSDREPDLVVPDQLARQRLLAERVSARRLAGQRPGFHRCSGQGALVQVRHHAGADHQVVLSTCPRTTTSRCSRTSNRYSSPSSSPLPRRRTICSN